MKISNFIICDDIRMETGNKFSLMGIYSNSINFNFTLEQENRWPTTKQICIFAQLEIEKEKLSDIHSFKIEIDYNKKKTEIGGGDIPLANPKPQQGVVLHAIFSNFKFQGPGDVKFAFIFYDKEKNKISEITSPLPLKVVEKIIKP